MDVMGCLFANVMLGYVISGFVANLLHGQSLQVSKIFTPVNCCDPWVDPVTLDEL
jgi:hypothetical protein